MAQNRFLTAADSAHLLDDRLRVVLDTAPASMWLANTDGAAVYLNRQWLNYTGLTADQALGWGWAGRVHQEDVTRLTEYWRTLLASAAPGQIETRLQRADGQYRWFLFSAAPLCDASGAIFGWCGTNVDIDESVRAREGLRN